MVCRGRFPMAIAWSNLQNSWSKPFQTPTTGKRHAQVDRTYRPPQPCQELQPCMQGTMWRKTPPGAAWGSGCCCPVPARLVGAGWMTGRLSALWPMSAPAIPIGGSISGPITSAPNICNHKLCVAAIFCCDAGRVLYMKVRGASSC